MRAVTLGALLIVAIAAACSTIACGSRQDRDLILRQKNLIDIRHSEIREWRREAGLDLEPRPQDVNQMRHKKSVDQAKAVCSSDLEVTEACAEVCTLAEHICDNAETICRIAAELDGDRWADDKCASAKASCRDAKKKCCTKCSQAKSP